MKIKDVIYTLECFAPLPLQEDYDNAGLQVGLTEAEVSGVLLCLDVTEDVIAEAEREGCNMIVSHHPLIFRKLRCVTDENYVQRCVMQAVKKDITIVAMHTNLDCAQGGVNYMIARKLGLDMNTVRLLGAHTVNGVEGGIGVIGEFPEDVSSREYMYKVKETFGASCVMGNELLHRPVRKVAICGGAGSFMLQQAMKEGADAFLTGEMHYHEYFVDNQQIQISVVGHYESERFTQNLLEEIITSKCPGVRTYVTKINTNPIKYY